MIVAIPACYVLLAMVSGLFWIAAWAILIASVVYLPVRLWLWVRNHSAYEAFLAIMRGLKYGVGFVLFWVILFLIWLPLVPIVRWVQGAYGIEWWMAVLTIFVTGAVAVYGTILYFRVVNWIGDRWFCD